MFKFKLRRAFHGALLLIRKRSVADPLYADCHLPVELWLEIFKNLSPEDIEVMSLVCKGLRFLALPSMCRHLDFFRNRYPLTERYVRLQIEWDSERFKFFTSNRIRHLVRRCTMTQPFGADDPRHLGVNMNKDLCPFFNLEELNCCKIFFNEGSLKALRSLPALNTLILRDCSVDLTAMPSPPPQVRLRHLEIESISRHGLNVFIDPDSLEILKFRSCQLPPSVFSRALPRLKFLRFLQCTVPPDYPDLPPFPELETLSYFLYSTTPDLVFSGLPKLKRFEGPSTGLFPILSGGTIESLYLPIVQETRLVPEALRQVALVNPHVQTLRLSLAYLTHGLLEAVCMFQALRDLIITPWALDAVPSDDTIQSHDEFVSKLLTLSFAPTIERICIGAPADVNPARGSSPEDRAPLLAWMAQHTRLRYLEIPGGARWERRVDPNHD